MVNNDYFWLGRFHVLNPTETEVAGGGNAGHLLQLLRYPDLALRFIIDLEPGRLQSASPVPLWDDSLSSPPIKVYPRSNI